MSANILHVVGARPNFMKIAPVLRELDKRGSARNVLLHSGQHYDADMSDAFFADLGIREPDVYLGVGSGSHAVQTAEVLRKTEKVLLEGEWHMVVVVGDVNSTLAAALAASKLNVPVAHVEAGLRSRDRGMPEEINRILTDQLSDLCLTPSRDADDNLKREGIPSSRIRFVGNVMIDSLYATLSDVEERPLPVPDLVSGRYAVVTLHRPSNVDDAGQLAEIVAGLEAIAEEVSLVFPIHPRTAKCLDAHGIKLRRVRALPPLGYRDMLALQSRAGLVLTDSGGIQEETTVLGVPCITLRTTTERPITIEQGTNRLLPIRTRETIVDAFHSAWGADTSGRKPEGWDGCAAIRVADAIEGFLDR